MPTTEYSGCTDCCGGGTCAETCGGAIPTIVFADDGVNVVELEWEGTFAWIADSPPAIFAGQETSGVLQMYCGDDSQVFLQIGPIPWANNPGDLTCSPFEVEIAVAPSGLATITA